MISTHDIVVLLIYCRYETTCVLSMNIIMCCCVCEHTDQDIRVFQELLMNRRRK